MCCWCLGCVDKFVAQYKQINMDAQKVAKLVETPYGFTFLLTFVVLAGSTFLTVLEVLFVKPNGQNPTSSNLAAALMLETGVNAIAGYFYYLFLQMVSSSSFDAVAPGIESLRSVDWLVTTPLMLSSLMFYYMYQKPEVCTPGDTCLVENLTTPKEDHPYDPLWIILLNTAMIVVGSSWWSAGKSLLYLWGRFFTSSIFFIVMIYLVYRSFYKPSRTIYKAEMTWFFLTSWALYPVVRGLVIQGTVSKAVTDSMYNVLDLVSKGGFGVLIWLVVQTLQNKCQAQCDL